MSVALKFAFAVATVAGLAAGTLLGYRMGPGIFEGSSDQVCPDPDNVTSTLAVNVTEKDRKLAIESDLQVQMSGVKPAQSPLNSLDLAGKRGSFVGCFLPGGAQLLNYEWSQGKLTARFALDSGILVKEAPDPFTTPPFVTAEMGSTTSTLRVDLCPSMRGNALICRDSAHTTIDVRVKGLKPQFEQPNLTLPVAEPFPQHADVTSEPSDFQWVFQGPAKKVSVLTSAPLTATAAAYLDSPDARVQPVIHLGRRSTLGVDLHDLALLISALAALLAGALYVGIADPGERKHRRLFIAVTLIGIALSAVGLGAVWLDIDDGNGGYAVTLLGWFVVMLGIAKTGRMRALAALLTLAGLGAISVLRILTDKIAYVGDSGRPVAPVIPKWHETAATSVQFTAVLLVTVIALTQVFNQVTGVFDLSVDLSTSDNNDQSQSATNTNQFRNMLSVLGAFALTAFLAFAAGRTWADAKVSSQPISWPRGLVTNLTDTCMTAGFTVRQLAPLLVVSILSGEVLHRKVSPKAQWNMPVGAVALMFALATPWSDAGVVIVVIALPLWLLQWLVLKLGQARWDKRDATGAFDRRDELVKIVRHAEAERPQHTDATDTGTESSSATEAFTETADSAKPLPLRGPRENSLQNAKFAASRAALIAVIPVAYFLWTTIGALGANPALTLNEGPLVVLISLITEAARWVVAGFVFGYFYPKLRGRIGPIKALEFAGLWALSCLAPTAFARALGINTFNEFTYRSAQFALFVIVLAIAIDYGTLKAAKPDATWRDIQSIYSLHQYREGVATFAAAALLVITLAQKIRGGSGFDVATAFLSGITNVIK